MRFIICLTLLTASCSVADTLELIKRTNYSGGFRKAIDGKIPFEGNRGLIEVVGRGDRLQVTSERGSILFSGDNLFVSEAKSSGEYICLHIRRGHERASSSVGLLLCRSSKGEVSSRLITSQTPAISGETYFFARLEKLEHPNISVIVGAHKKNEAGAYWTAKYQTTEPEKGMNRERREKGSGKGVSRRIEH